MTTAERIKQRRKELGLRAEDVAEKIGVSRSTVFRYESGEIEKLPYTNLVPIAKALNTTVEYLMFGCAENEKTPIPETGNGLSDDDSEIISLLANLPEEKKHQAMVFLRFLASNEDK